MHSGIPAAPESPRLALRLLRRSQQLADEVGVLRIVRRPDRLAASIGFLAPRMVVKTPTSRMNLPHKEYWLAPEHRAETFDFFEKSFAWYGCIFLLLEVSTMEIVIRANLRTPPQLPIGPIVLLISAFALLNFACVIAIFRRFSRPR
jgi:hypothetical protein